MNNIIIQNTNGTLFNMSQVLLDQNQELMKSIDTVWLIVTIACIFMMQLGFLLLESGSIAESHSLTIILKNASDASFGMMAWYLIGNNIYSGKGSLPNDTDEFLPWFQSYVFAVTTATILSGGVACRIKFSAYLAYSSILTGWVYPWVARFAWGNDEWLSNQGFLDFAGSGPVHLLGGVSALVGTIALRPRKYRFAPDGRDNQPAGSSTSNFVTGAFLLWFGWFSFNAGSSGGMGPDVRNLAIRAAMNTLIASAGAGMTSVIVSLTFFRHKVLTVVVNGILGGLVGITAGCAYVSTHAALFIGFFSVIIVTSASELLIKLKVDDPLDASPVHGACGFFGVIALGIFHETDGLIAGETKLMGAQLIGALFITGWAALHAILFFFPLRPFIRVSVEKELAGLDNTYMDKNDTLDAHKIREHNDIKHAQKSIAAKKKKNSKIHLANDGSMTTTSCSSARSQ